MPWEMMVLSRATTGRPAASAAATSADTTMPAGYRWDGDRKIWLGARTCSSFTPTNKAGKPYKVGRPAAKRWGHTQGPGTFDGTPDLSRLQGGKPEQPLSAPRSPATLLHSGWAAENFKLFCKTRCQLG